MAKAREPMTVCTYGFNVPCRRFLITANVTRDRRLPVVDEFVLRTLKVCERIPVRRLGAYFGFSEAETETVVADLASRSLIETHDDAITLHGSAHDLFRGAEDGSPRLMEIETWVERIWFDLVSRNIMVPERIRSARNLIEIQQQDLARDLPTSFARKAFEENFAEYLRRVRRITDPERLGLYSISEVEAGRFGYVVVKGRDDLLLDPEPKIEPHLLEFDVDNFARFRPLGDAIADAYRRLSWPAASAAALSDFFRLTGDQSITRKYDTDGLFDLSAWIDAQGGAENPDWRFIVGSTYIDRNIGLFIRLLETRAVARIASDQPRDLDLLWFRPLGSQWGTSPDLAEALTTLRGAVRRSLSKTWGIRTHLLVPHVARNESIRRFDRIFDEAYVLPAGHFSPAIEVILLRGVGAIATVPTRLSPTLAVPSGFATVDPQAISRLETNLRLDFLGTTAPIWRRPRGDRDDEAPSMEAAGSLPSAV